MNVWDIIVAAAAGGGFVLSFVLAIAKLVEYLKKREGTLEIIIHHRPILNFTKWGPTIRVSMTLRADKRDVFIRSMGIELVRVADNLTKSMKWLLFEDSRRDATAENLPPIYVYTASAFSVSPKYPRPMEILFQDQEAADTLYLINEELMKEFQEWGKTKGYDPITLSADVNKLNAAISEFNDQRDVDFYTRTQKLFYFDKGGYKCTLTATIGKGKTYNKTFEFNLDTKQVKRLELSYVGLSYLYPPGKGPMSFPVSIKVKPTDLGVETDS